MPGMLAAGLSTPQACALLRSGVALAAEARDAFWAAQQQQQNSPAAVPAGEPAAGSSGRPQSCGMRRRPLIAFSSGSYGAYLADGSEFSGGYASSVSEQELAEFHAARIQAVRDDPRVWDQVDMIAFETVPCLHEARAIARLLKDQRYGKRAWISFSCRDSMRTCAGDDLAHECIPALVSERADDLWAVGVNCTAPEHVPGLLAAAGAAIRALNVGQEGQLPLHAGPAGRALGVGSGAEGGVPAGGTPLGAAAPLRLLCYPNSGERWDGVHKCWHGCSSDIADPDRYAEAVAGWVRDYGLSAVGGCCRTSPLHIAALRQRLGMDALS